MLIRKTITERIFDFIIIFVLCGVVVVCIYPFIYVFSMSISSPLAVSTNSVWLLPKGFSIETYKMVLRSASIWTSYYNTIWYTVVGTGINLIMITLGAYPLSRKEFFARNYLMVYIAFTMFFSGGLIPAFILVNNLGLYNTRWAIVLPSAVSTWFLIITRVYFQTTIPDSLPESAKVEGCNDIGILLRIVVPNATPIFATVALFAAVGFWNSYFPALIYLPNVNLQPMTILLQKLLIAHSADTMVGIMDEGIAQRQMFSMQLRYSVIIITILPIVCIYPFLQKYFIKGIMIGSIKG